MNRLLGLFAVVSSSCLLLSNTLVAQQGPPPGIPNAQQLRDQYQKCPTIDCGSLDMTHDVNVIQNAGSGYVLLVTVHNGNRLLDQQAVVQLDNSALKSVVWQPTNDGAIAGFDMLPIGKYDIEVSAVGYLSAHTEFTIAAAAKVQHVDVSLKPDPEAIKLDSESVSLPPKARKEMLRATENLKSGKLKEAEKHLWAAQALSPNSPDISFLFGYLFFEKKDFQKAEDCLTAAANADSQDMRALILLARVRMLRQDYPRAGEILERAAALHPSNWMSHNLLGQVYIQQHEYEKALTQAQLAVDTSNGASDVPRLVLAEALANTGKYNQATENLRSFLRSSADSPYASVARDLLSQIEEITSASAGADGTAARPVLAISNGTLFAATEPEFSVKSWEPPGIDEMKPSVAPGATCPAEQVIANAGKRAKELVDDVSRFSAIEDIVNEDLDNLGNPVTKESRKFNYTVTFTETQPTGFVINEDRVIQTRIDDFPGHIATFGLPALALIFHPEMRDDFEITCEGLGEWHGQATWLLHFRQRPDRPNRMHEYQVGTQLYSASLKGRAWVSADSFRIVRMDSELVAPLREIKLFRERYSVDYAPVYFKKRQVQLWLPKTAELYFDFQSHHYLRRHTFEDFLLFSVDSDEKRKEPTVKVDSPAPNPS